MGIFAAIIMGFFIYYASGFLFDNIIVGTSDAVVVTGNIVPIALAGIVAIVVIGIFRA